MTWLILGALLPALLTCWILTFAVRRLAPLLGLMDKPNARKVHVVPTPLGGGLAIWAGVLLPFAVGSLALLWGIESSGDEAALKYSLFGHDLPEFVGRHLPGIRQQLGDLWYLLGLGSVLVLLGLIDDRQGLNWKFRLGVQFAVALAVVLRGWTLTLYIDLPWLTGLVSVLWIVALINSFNMLDNMDGLSGGVAVIAGSVLAAVLLLPPSPEAGQPHLFVGGLLLVMVGSALGFLWHNRPPARIFMGDAGSYFLGYLLATSTILATFTNGSLPPHSVAAPLFVLAVPLYDMTTVIWIRLRQGRSIFQADKSHFSHRLVELGMTKTQAVLTIYLTTAACGLGAFLLNQVNLLGAGIILLLVLSMLCLVGILESIGRRPKN